MGCYIDRDLHVKDSCGLIDPKFRAADTYYLFNHVDLTITYHSGKAAEWGQIFGQSSGRIICMSTFVLGWMMINKLNHFYYVIDFQPLQTIQHSTSKRIVTFHLIF